MSGPRAIGLLAAFALLGGCTPKERIHVEAPAGNWISLFNGKDLSDWTAKIAGHDVNENYRNTFRAEDGLLKVSCAQYDGFGRQFGSLFYKKAFSRYWLRAEYRFVGDQAPGAPSWAYKDSGLQLHSQSPESMRKDQEFPVSVEFNIIGGHAFGSRPTGDVCRNATRVRVSGVPLKDQCSKLSDITIRGDEWVTVLAEVQGASHARQIVNGDLVVDYTDLELDEDDPDARRLIGAGKEKALSSGYISIQSNSHPIEFRRIEVLPLDPR